MSLPTADRLIISLVFLPHLLRVLSSTVMLGKYSGKDILLFFN